MDFLFQKTFLLSLILVFSCSPETQNVEKDTDNIQYTLIVSATEGGSVSTDGGIYDKGTEVTITAIPREGYRFAGWEGSDSTNNSITIIINSSQTYLALFEEIKYQYNDLIPLGGNAYNTSDLRTLLIDPNGIKSWTNKENKIAVYFYSSKELDCKFNIPIESSQSSISYSVSLNENSFEVEVFPNESKIDLGIHFLRKGYNVITLKGLKTGNIFPKIENLQVFSNEPLDLYYVKENSSRRFYWGRRGPSVTLRYEFPENTNIKWMYSEVMIPEGYDKIGMFAMANGSDQGYFGIQVKSLVERWILFSIWSPYNTDNHDDVPADQRIQLIKSGEDVTIKPFEGEGSGGQSYLIYPWKAGVKYSFLKSVEPDGNGNTIYTAYFKDPNVGEWKLIASFLRPITNTYYTGAFSFLENFDPGESFKTRKAYYNNLWAINSNGDWFRLNNARFTVDDIGRREYRLDYQGGVEMNKFYLMHCGFFDTRTENNKNLKKIDQSDQPSIEFDLLP